MLYDPKWEKVPETKVDPISLPALIAWMETRDPRETYDFHNCSGGCLVGLYYVETLGGDFLFQPDRPTFGDVFGAYGSPERDNGYTKIAATRPYTLGAALERAREFVRAND